MENKTNHPQLFSKLAKILDITTEVLVGMTAAYFAGYIAFQEEGALLTTCSFPLVYYSYKRDYNN